MKKGKPIEPGCLALIVGVKVDSNNNGRVVRVIHGYRGVWSPPGVPPHSVNPKYDMTAQRWVVAVAADQPPLEWSLTKRRTGEKSRTFFVRERGHRENCLLRIDDGEQPQEETTIRERELTLSGETA